jgi:hypothetical protein
MSATKSVATEHAAVSSVQRTPSGIYSYELRAQQYGQDYLFVFSSYVQRIQQANGYDAALDELRECTTGALADVSRSIANSFKVHVPKDGAWRQTREPDGIEATLVIRSRTPLAAGMHAVRNQRPLPGTPLAA